MSDRATMQRETSLIRIRKHAARNRDWRAARTLRTADSILKARNYWAPDSYWGRRYPGKREA